MLNIKTPVFKLYMVGPVYAKKLQKLGINTIGDLLYHTPSRYEDFSVISKINNLHRGEKATVIGEISKFENTYTKFGKRIQKAVLRDETGEIEIVFFNQPFLSSVLLPKTRTAVCGEVSVFGRKLVFESPQYELIKSTINNQPARNATPAYSDTESSVEHSVAGGQPAIHLIHTGRLVPIYPETEGISSKWLRSRIDSILYKLNLQIPELLPKEILKQFDLIPRKQAFYNIHFPTSIREEKKAGYRMAFEELLILIMAAIIRKNKWEKQTVLHKMNLLPNQPLIDKFIQKLAFKLTISQQNAINEILGDLSQNKPMNRLLVGDVGSGKTIVAAIALYLSCLNGCQSVLMAPTQILASQHYQTISKLLSPLGIKISLISGANKPEGKKTHKSDIYIGTHALLSQKFPLDNLGFVVIDEQQRFGVTQRAIIREKGQNPHVLIMTATPIPRTIALTIYADLDLSVLTQMPPGRLKIKTWVVSPQKRQSAYQWMKHQIKNTKIKQQAFIVCPLIDQSETMETVKAAVVEYKRLKEDIFKDLSVDILHGRLSPHKKLNVLKKFRDGKVDILVATPVVEVGIDIPNATIMMIEAAERFGLAQLHQLRGRIGRRNIQSYCLLFYESQNPQVLARLKLLETIHNGPKLAQEDLALRGAGEMFGKRQHGHLELKFADFSDTDLIGKTKKAANVLFRLDLTLSSFPLLRQTLEKYTIESIASD